MADKKISELVVATTILGPDLIPIVSDGVNKSVSASVLSSNLPSIGNKGITKNIVLTATVPAIPLTGTVVALPVSVSSYTLGTGVDGQELTIVSLGANVVLPIASYFTSLTLSPGSSATLLYIASVSKWFIKSSFGVVIA